MYKQAEFTIKGVVPTLIHSGQLANPLNQVAKEMKKISSKRKKTDEDHILLGDLEWLGSFYASEEGTFNVVGDHLEIIGFGRPNWPGDAVEIMLRDAARKNKLGKQFTSGIMCQGPFFLDFGENKTIPELYRDTRYRDTRSVKLQGKTTVMRTRPIFHSWKLKVVVDYLPKIIDQAQIAEAMDIAGQLIGLSDYRPKFGRFLVQ